MKQTKYFCDMCKKEIKKYDTDCYDIYHLVTFSVLDEKNKKLGLMIPYGVGKINPLNLEICDECMKNLARIIKNLTLEEEENACQKH